MIELKFTQCEQQKPDDSFGYGDYMLKLRHKKNGGWLYAELCPRAEVGVFPSAAALGVCVEETVHLVPREDKKLAAFRFSDYIERLDEQAKSMGLPLIDRELTVYCIKQLVSCMRGYLTGANVFLQLTLFSLETDEAVFPSREAVLTVTVKKEPFFSMQPIRVCTSDDCIMTRPHKFGAPFLTTVRYGLHEAKRRGYDNVLWLDSMYRRYVDSLAGMDVFFHIGDEVVCTGDGISAKSAVSLMNEWGIEVKKDRVSTDRLVRAYENGEITEVFALSTKNIVCPVVLLDINGETFETKRTKLAKKLFDTLWGIMSGAHPDGFGWVTLL